ncbi:HAD-IB family hydrolase [Clostridium saccharobutylicum]|uniref:HAD-superfamily subfamily IB hydrolase n=1 Tax=Clostridium saccharobutylicum DSM 13864 TaxID=1345695 RepID=U5MZM2_CLOSA|nr:HAD-IB family hydrolase [Clostridium saccharobutylicum]AGX44947.1 HAD-superfamily subfamily IB hydrolase [Clostridium saccharobutylicum DSM 13864]AQR92229.1 haloacid dehalogenase-like hydrolase [Clostridium saccharobutylicum]AQS02131.1 haloacid dehalogenase-like hydrolase [Clostridium saccharobutylicum]AQS11735.1 haloacid dehalogenase-like hydrolase [Clostridium saccharobutylicum]AQS16114.1 haloacid dehalogenase-like hydrolase [Clostridium saccharobutylicum]
MKKLAIFDIDYTITKKETLMELFKYMIKNDRKNIRFLPRAIYCGIMYGLKIYDERKVKETFLKFIDKIHEKDLADLVRKFYDEKLQTILYEDALKMMKKLKSEGYDIYLISASPEFYINEFYAIKEVDKIIGTRFDFTDGVFTRKMQGENCKGEEKVRRLKEFLKSENIEVDFKESYMFSDSLSDKPLLDLVGKPYLINYKKNHNIEILNWK